MEELRIDKTYFPALREMVSSGEMSEDALREYMYGELSVALAIDRLLEDGEGELTEGDCDRIGTELPPGLYQYIRVTDDGNRPRVLGTFYMRTVDGVLDELWLARARRGMSPNPVDTVSRIPSYIPKRDTPDAEKFAPQPHTIRERSESLPLLPDARGSQGVSGQRPTRMVELIEYEDGDHHWRFLTSNGGTPYTVRSTILAPVLQKLREQVVDTKTKKVSLSLLRKAVDSQQEALRGVRKGEGVN